MEANECLRFSKIDRNLINHPADEVSVSYIIDRRPPECERCAQLCQMFVDIITTCRSPECERCAQISKTDTSLIKTILLMRSWRLMIKDRRPQISRVREICQQFVDIIAACRSPECERCAQLCQQLVDISMDRIGDGWMVYG